MKTHTSKIDGWVYAVIIGVAVLPLLLGAIDGVLIWPAVAICGATAALMIWLYFATKYVITDETLTIHGGLFKVSIPVSSIISVTDSRDAISSPAFSLDRLEIKYGEGKMILISPKDKAAFCADLNLAKV